RLEHVIEGLRQSVLLFEGAGLHIGLLGRLAFGRGLGDGRGERDDEEQAREGLRASKQRVHGTSPSARRRVIAGEKVIRPHPLPSGKGPADAPVGSALRGRKWTNQKKEILLR